MKIIQLKAYEVMGSPDYYNCLVTFGKSKIEWECQNYSRNGDTIRFSRLDPVTAENGEWVFKITNKYVDPYSIVNVILKD
jgi:hypothetical protein